MRFPPPVVPSGAPDARSYKSDRFELGSLTDIVLVHDYLCPWSWIGLHHAKRLQQEYGVTFDWRGGELIPPSMEIHPPAPKPAPDPNAPPPAPAPKSRFDLFVETEGYVMPNPRPPFLRTHHALLAAEWAWMEAHEGFEALNEAIYRAYWEERQDIADIDVLADIAASVGLNGTALEESVRSLRYEDHILPFDDDAYAAGIRNIPTFIFNGTEKLAEANYTDLAHATERFLVRAERIREKHGIHAGQERGR